MDDSQKLPTTIDIRFDSRSNMERVRDEALMKYQENVRRKQCY